MKSALSPLTNTVVAVDSNLGMLPIVRHLRLTGCHIDNLLYLPLRDSSGMGNGNLHDLRAEITGIASRLLRAGARPIVACNTMQALLESDPSMPQMPGPINGTIQALLETVHRPESSVLVIGSPALGATGSYSQKLAAHGCQNVIFHPAPEIIHDIASVRKEGGPPPGIAARLGKIIQFHRRTTLLSAVALSCTHFSIFADEVRTLVGKELKIVDSGEELCRNRQLQPLLRSGRVETPETMNVILPPGQSGDIFCSLINQYEPALKLEFLPSCRALF